MDLDTLVKYLIWIVFFGVVLAGIYFMMKKLGIL